ncbi:MAG: HAD-IA family hydrolase, partial [Lachnospiraceae bacterium]|nr:HAD-IA family hydrolase [Lachnospiraceae bacterium]
TILNTAPDLTAAMNYAMKVHGHRHDYVNADGCLFFGSGAHTAVQRALALEAGMDRDKILQIGSAENGEVPGIDESEVLEILATYSPYYKAHNAIDTNPYDGITDLLKNLRAAGVKTAVVSNKPDNSVVQLAADYFDGGFDLAIGETEGIARKPAPDMNFLILDKLGIQAGDAVYIGDTEIDFATAANTGMDLIMVDWGFRPRVQLEALGAKVFASTAQEVFELIRDGCRS